MAKQFSAREFGLLMAPVLVVGAAGFWASKRPIDDGKPHLTFRIEKPTTLEAFEGAQGVFVLSLKQSRGRFRIDETFAYLKLQAVSGPITLRYGQERQGWGTIWQHNFDSGRFAANLNRIPPGQLSFGTQSLVEHDYQGAGPPILPREPFPLRAEWKIDRAQVEAPNLAAMPREPLVSLQQVVVKSKTDGTVTGEATFHLDSDAMSDSTTFQTRLHCISWSVPGSTPETPHTRVIECIQDTCGPTKLTGRVSADNRWPLGFEIGPFDFNTTKVRQKLRFKQFPVALPKS